MYPKTERIHAQHAGQKGPPAFQMCRSVRDGRSGPLVQGVLFHPIGLLRIAPPISQTNDRSLLTAAHFTPPATLLFALSCTFPIASSPAGDGHMCLRVHG